MSKLSQRIRGLWERMLPPTPQAGQPTPIDFGQPVEHTPLPATAQGGDLERSIRLLRAQGKGRTLIARELQTTVSKVRTVEEHAARAGRPIPRTPVKPKAVKIKRDVK